MFRWIFRNRISFIVLLVLSFTSSALATSIHVEWGYTPPSEPPLIGFKLYREGEFVCETKNPNATSMDCELEIYKETTDFTLTAIFSDGSESPQSPPYSFTITDDKQIILLYLYKIEVEDVK